jgi:hypothetical protein
MEKSSKKNNLKFGLSVIAGAGAAFIMALILYPIVRIIFDNFFHLFSGSDAPKNLWVDDLIVQLNFMLWFFISSASGGFVSAILSPFKEWIFVTASMIIVIVVITIITDASVFIDGADAWFIMMMIPAGFFTGLWVEKKWKARKAKNKINTSDTQDSSINPDVL